MKRLIAKHFDNGNKLFWVSNYADVWSVYKYKPKFEISTFDNKDYLHIDITIGYWLISYSDFNSDHPSILQLKCSMLFCIWMILNVLIFIKAMGGGSI